MGTLMWTHGIPPSVGTDTGGGSVGTVGYDNFKITVILFLQGRCQLLNFEAGWLLLMPTIAKRTTKGGSALASVYSLCQGTCPECMRRDATHMEYKVECAHVILGEGLLSVLL